MRQAPVWARARHSLLQLGVKSDLSSIDHPPPNLSGRQLAQESAARDAQHLLFSMHRSSEGTEKSLDAHRGQAGR